jgi:hypothetical protein
MIPIPAIGSSFEVIAFKMRSKTDLIVPIRDRRRGRRYLTLKNLAIAAAVMVVSFVAISIRSEMRGSGPANYGRLVERQMPKVVEQKQLEVVHEAQVVDQELTHADPMAIQPMIREQYLHAQTPAPAVDLPQRTEASLVSGETDVAVVGGPEGVQVVQRERRRPLLKGGFGR